MKAEWNTVLPFLGLAVGLALGACQQQAHAPADAGIEAAAAELSMPPFSVNRQMVSLIDNQSHVLWRAEEAATPAA